MTEPKENPMKWRDCAIDILWRYTTPLYVTLVAVIVFLISALLPVGDCRIPADGDQRLCAKATDTLALYLKANVDFLETTPPKPTPVSPAEPLSALEQAIRFTPPPAPEKASAALTGAAALQATSVTDNGSGKTAEEVEAATETADEDANDSDVDGETSPDAKAREAAAELASNAATVELARQQVFGRDLTAWLVLDSAETVARVAWMSTLAATAIALALMAMTGFAIGLRAITDLEGETTAIVVVVAGLVTAVAMGVFAIYQLDSFFLNSWPRLFVEAELRKDLKLSWLYFLLGFGAVVLLAGVALRLAVPPYVEPFLRQPWLVHAQTSAAADRAANAPNDDDRGIASVVVAETNKELRRARVWLAELLDDLNRAVLVVAAALVLGVLHVYALLSWPLALVGGCGEGQALPEVKGACAAVGQMVTGTGLLGSLVLGALVVPAVTVARGMALRLAEAAADSKEQSDWLDQAGLATSYWGTIARIAAVLAPLLPGLLAQVIQGLGSASP